MLCVKCGAHDRPAGADKADGSAVEGGGRTPGYKRRYYGKSMAVTGQKKSIYKKPVSASGKNVRAQEMPGNYTGYFVSVYEGIVSAADITRKK